MIYEMRTYRILEGKMPDILSRFENITFGLFDRYGIEVMGFWQKTDANEIVYICKYEGEAAMERAWAGFRADPEWIEARARTEANGPIVSEVISEMMTATSFSPVQ